jgi:sucrose-6F-phosphate phosphohydrolase
LSTLRLLLCTDLDRTLLPNGPQPESPQARDMLRQLVAHECVTLVYVSGRHQRLVEAAIRIWQIPVPDYVITDVGTRIHHVHDHEWQDQVEWEHRIGADWAGKSWQDLHAVLRDLTDLRLQEVEKQNRYKLSYFVPLGTRTEKLEHNIHQRLAAIGVNAKLVWSKDEPAAIGLLDVLPQSAGKLEAILFLMQQLGYQLTETVFSGDSGNDLEVLTSEIPAVLVANANPEVREMAMAVADEAGTRDALYVARGDFLDMNGNYGAGIIEGVIHYRPEMQTWLGQTPQKFP